MYIRWIENLSIVNCNVENYSINKAAEKTATLAETGLH